MFSFFKDLFKPGQIKPAQEFTKQQILDVLELLVAMREVQEDELVLAEVGGACTVRILDDGEIEPFRVNFNLSDETCKKVLCLLKNPELQKKLYAKREYRYKRQQLIESLGHEIETHLMNLKKDSSDKREIKRFSDTILFRVESLIDLKMKYL